MRLFKSCRPTSSVRGAPGSLEDPSRYVLRECGNSESRAMLVSHPDLCLSGVFIAGYLDPVDMSNTSITSKSQSPAYCCFLKIACDTEDLCFTLHNETGSGENRKVLN